MHVTLKHRITTSIAVFAVVLISAFAAIQVQNRLHVITIFNSLQAKLTAQIIKDALGKSLDEPDAQEDIGKALNKSLASLAGAGLFDAAYVYYDNGIIAASTNNMHIGKGAGGQEQANIKQAIKDMPSAKSVHAHVDKRTRTLSLYIPLQSKTGSVSYVGRIDMPLGNMQEALKQVYIPLLLTVIVVGVSSVFFGMVLSRRVTEPISLLNTATKEIAAGDLNLKIHTNTNDELEELSDTFNLMAIELKKMRQKVENKKRGQTPI